MQKNKIQEFEEEFIARYNLEFGTAITVKEIYESMPAGAFHQMQSMLILKLLLKEEK